MKNYIFYLRPLAAFSVVCTHISAVLYDDKTIYVDMVNKFSFWAVPVFIMISGAILMGGEINQ